jgi:hypothetical protein
MMLTFITRLLKVSAEVSVEKPGAAGARSSLSNRERLPLVTAGYF